MSITGPLVCCGRDFVAWAALTYTCFTGPRDLNWVPVRAFTLYFCHARGQVIITLIPHEWCHLICQSYRETSHVVYTGHNPLYKADFNFFFVIRHELHWINNRDVADALFMSKIYIIFIKTYQSIKTCWVLIRSMIPQLKAPDSSIFIH